MKEIETIASEELVTATGGDASAASTGCTETPEERAQRMRSPFEGLGATAGNPYIGKPRPGGPTIFNPRPSDILGTGSRFPR